MDRTSVVVTSVAVTSVAVTSIAGSSVAVTLVAGWLLVEVTSVAGSSQSVAPEQSRLDLDPQLALLPVEGSLYIVEEL